ncbi:Alpha/Beta hydrolase protein [Rhexocercosporidium sp. MPI-PUGE-AT-0058]|nr:Alpha/Beta hydrolase protein [Rhexocercosporidium sp. MPI-PUGE-AT-0058]
MDQIKDLHHSSGPSIQVILAPTFKIFIPLLLASKDSITSTPVTTHSYGPHPRQKLDIYTSPTDTLSTPILIFFHGGGFIKGDKNLPAGDGGLIYANLGSFFAQRGITTVVANYRRVDFEGGGEGAKFPSGGEDVGAALEWVDGFMEGERDVYLMGNSAGGVHVATFLFGREFEEVRGKYVKGNGKGVVLKGAVELAFPCHYEDPNEDRKGVLETYYGCEEVWNEKCVCALIESARKSGKGKRELGIPEKIFVGVGEFDPEDEIAASMKDFVKRWKEAFGEEGFVFKVLEGHNHISPPLALMSGDKMAEQWGEDVVKWIKDA